MNEKKLWLLVTEGTTITEKSDLDQIDSCTPYSSYEDAREAFNFGDDNYIIEVTINKIETDRPSEETPLMEVVLKK